MTRQALQAAQDKQKFLTSFAETLPPEQRSAFMASPDVFIKERFAPYTLKPGEGRYIGGQSVVSAPPEQKLVDVPVPGQPGVTQPTWIAPGQTTGTTVGGTKSPAILNPDVQAAQVAVAQAGKPSVNVTVRNKVGESLAGKVGDIAQSGQSSAAGAVDVVDTVNRVRNAIQSGNVNLGPTATLRNKADQFAQVMGVGGETTDQRLVNTRNVIRGLAQFTIGARKQLKGQGQVSDYESRLLQRAESGEIDDFTLPELKDFLGVTDRIARKSHAEHKRILGVMGNSKDEEVRNLVPYFDVPDLPTNPVNAGGPSIDFGALPKRKR